MFRKRIWGESVSSLLRVRTEGLKSLVIINLKMYTLINFLKCSFLKCALLSYAFLISFLILVYLKSGFVMDHSHFLDRFPLVTGSLVQASLVVVGRVSRLSCSNPSSRLSGMLHSSLLCFQGLGIYSGFMGRNTNINYLLSCYRDPVGWKGYINLDSG